MGDRLRRIQRKGVGEAGRKEQALGVDERFRRGDGNAAVHLYRYPVIADLK